MSDVRLRLAYGGLHPDRLAKLVDHYGGESPVLRAIESRRVKVSDEARIAVLRPVEHRRRELAEAGMRFIDRGSQDYPPHLAALPGSPPALFLRGRLPDMAGVAIVGTRSCTAYGRRLANAYGRAVAGAGWPLISGLARGIDGAAHRGTVDALGVGIAVLGSGLDVLYPREHTNLASDLLDLDGAIVSEYPPGAAPLAWRFPPRNRIISGLARAVVVVEAGVKGGALITARLALDQGISVFAVPGDIDRDSSRGCNLLIRDGAHPVLDPHDLIEELALVLGPPAESEHPGSGPRDPLLGILARSGAVSVDQAAERLQMPIADVLVRVVELEASGHIDFDGAVLRANGH